MLFRSGNIKPVAGAPDEYTIQKGDTLWDLSQKFLNNPWYWPKIWSLNPGIENPHWIYPGNKLRIVPGEGGAQSPAQVQAEEPEGGIDATALNAPEEPLPGVSQDTNVSLPTTPDLDVVGTERMALLERGPGRVALGRRPQATTAKKLV